MAEKMTKIPLKHPETGQILLNPETKQPIPMVHTGKIEELIHECVLYNMYPLIYYNAEFADQKKDLEKFKEEYGNYISSYIQNYLINNAQNPSTGLTKVIGSGNGSNKTAVNSGVNKGIAKKKTG